MKKRKSSTAGLSADARKWLEGSGPSFTQFKDHDELVALWLAHGDESVATWDMDEDSRPRPVAE
jgi:hypothetical protein